MSQSPPPTPHPKFSFWGKPSITSEPSAKVKLSASHPSMLIPSDLIKVALEQVKARFLGQCAKDLESKPGMNTDDQDHENKTTIASKSRDLDVGVGIVLDRFHMGDGTMVKRARLEPEDFDLLEGGFVVLEIMAKQLRKGMALEGMEQKIGYVEKSVEKIEQQIMKTEAEEDGWTFVEV